jgi:hypothetical protein
MGNKKVRFTSNGRQDTTHRDMMTMPQVTIERGPDGQKNLHY